MKTNTEAPPLGRYKDCEPLYRDKGYALIPVGDQKEPKGKGWTSRNPTEAEIAERMHRFPNANVGLLAGTPITADKTLAFVDVDDDRVTALALVVFAPLVTGKKGAKGLTIVAQAEQGLKSCKLYGQNRAKPAVEFFIDSGMVVIPDSMHPSGVRYTWVGEPLLEVDPRTLPVVTAEKIAVLKAVLGNASTWEIIEAGSGISGHQPMLSLTSSGIANLTDDLVWLADCLKALFHPNYEGDTKDEVLEMLQSAKAKGLGSMSFSSDRYEHGREGPVPLGYLADGRFVFFEQTRRIPIVETSNRLTQYGCLLNLAPATFWDNEFGTKGKVDAIKAGKVLMQACRDKGGFDEARVRGRGVYIEKGEVVRNFGENVPDSTDYTYICHIPLKIGDARAPMDPAAVLRFLQLFNWTKASAAYMLFGWTISAVICGALTWRPHVFLTGAKNTGKTTLVNAIRSLLEKVVVALDGTSSEAGIRQKLGPDSRPVIIDEFESDQNIGRMRQVIKLMRSASSGDLSVARGTPEGKALEFNIRSSFLLAAINAMAVTAADRSRIVSLALGKHDNDKVRASQIAEAAQHFEGASAGWCLQIIDRTADILTSIKTVQRVFPPCDSRHALNMSTLLGAAWTMLNGHAIDEKSARALIEEHWPFIAELSEAHEEDDAEECLNALLQFRVRNWEGDRLLGDILGDITRMTSPDRPKGVDGSALANAKNLIEPYGLKWESGGLLVANSHRGLADIYRGTLWEAGNWGSSLKRLPGATATTQRRFGSEGRSLGTLIPAGLIPAREEVERAF